MTESELEYTLRYMIALSGLPAPEQEVCLIPGRRFRVDFLWREQKLIVEAEGAVWTQGRHTRGAGYSADCEKYNLLTLMGYRVLRFTTATVLDGTAVQQIAQALKQAPDALAILKELEEATE